MMASAALAGSGTSAEQVLAFLSKLSPEEAASLFARSQAAKKEEDGEVVPPPPAPSVARPVAAASAPLCKLGSCADPGCSCEEAADESSTKQGSADATASALAALAAGNLKRAKDVCREIDFFLIGEDGWSCLHWAVHVTGSALSSSRQRSSCEDHPEDADTGCGCCMAAPASSRGPGLELVRLLLDRASSAAVNLANLDGATPLMFAADAGDDEVCDWLLEAGADRTLKDSDGDTAADWALSRGRKILAHRLRPE